MQMTVHRTIQRAGTRVGSLHPEEAGGQELAYCRPDTCLGCGYTDYVVIA